jgi:prolyl oligopeptidase
MFLVHRRDLDRSKSHPTYLYGYGGFNISLTPQFSPAMAVWMERGGIFAQPTLRGGGEFGADWHNAGRLHQKQNVYDDYIGEAVWLIDEGMTTPSQMAIAGGSNGGLLVGAAMTQRPELFAACLPSVGVMDMLRFHEFTIGWAWVPEYGSSADEAQFKSLFAYSPLHNLRPKVAYPATMVLTADHDDRVVPCHSFKFAAALQDAQGGSAPCVIRVETQAGHGAGVPTSKRIEEAADRLAFAEAAVLMR